MAPHAPKHNSNVRSILQMMQSWRKMLNAVDDFRIEDRAALIERKTDFLWKSGLLSHSERGIFVSIEGN